MSSSGTSAAQTTATSVPASAGPPPNSQSPSESRNEPERPSGSSPGGIISNAGNQHYSLRWNNHQSHVLSAFEALLQNESLVDCTLVCEDTSIRAHKVVLSACSPYFQKIFVDNPCKHPIIVLKDIRGWEVQCIVDFMYKGETSVPEDQLTSLIKAAESLKVRGLTSSDQVSRNAHLEATRSRSPLHIPQHPNMNGYLHGSAGGVHPPPSHHSLPHRGYSHSPARSTGGYIDQEPAAKIQHMSHSNQSSPMSLTNHQDDRDRHNAANRASPGPAGSGPRRKQARPRRRSGDSIGNASLDLSKSDSPPLSSLSGASNNNGFGSGARAKNSSPSSSTLTQQHADETPENLSLNRPSSSPAINLVKTEHLMDPSRSRDHSRVQMDRAHSSDPHLRQSHHLPPHRDDIKPPPSSPFMGAAAVDNKHIYGNGLHPLQEHEARAEALQALNFMAAGGGLPHHFPGHPLAHAPHAVQNPHLTPSSLASLAAAGAAAAAASGRPTSTPSVPSNTYPGLVRSHKAQHSAPRGGPPRSWTNDELTKALENVWNKRMTTSQASRIYGIPYNSLLMYVRGKYGKSLKLDKLKKTTPAAHDTLNTIGNSRSTPKEKLLAKASKVAAVAMQQAFRSSDSEQQATANPSFPFELLQKCSQIKEVILDMQNQHSYVTHAERLRELEKYMSPEQARMLLPFLERQAAEMANIANSAAASGEEFARSPSAQTSHSPSTHTSSHSPPSTITSADMEDVEEYVAVGESAKDHQHGSSQGGAEGSVSQEEKLAKLIQKEQQVRSMLIKAAASRSQEDVDVDGDVDGDVDVEATQSAAPPEDEASGSGLSDSEDKKEDEAPTLVPKPASSIPS